MAKVKTIIPQSNCCPLQSPENGLPCFGVSLLSPSSPSLSSSSSPHPMLQLLGLTDQELQEQMAKGHIYAFNMGNNNIIPFKDFQEAAKVLMERNMPEILHNKQKQAVFIPETHLPNIPRCVDEEEYKAKKAKLDKPDLRLLQMKAGSEDSQHIAPSRALFGASFCRSRF